MNNYYRQFPVWKIATFETRFFFALNCNDRSNTFPSKTYRADNQMIGLQCYLFQCKWSTFYGVDVRIYCTFTVHHISKITSFFRNLFLDFGNSANFFIFRLCELDCHAVVEWTPRVQCEYGEHWISDIKNEQFRAIIVFNNIKVRKFAAQEATK